LTTTFALLFYYREGGVKDANIPNPGPRDVGVYIAAGNAILRGLNPYELVGNRFGAVGAVPFGVIDFFVPENLTTVIFQILNIVGVIFFIRTVVQVKVKYGKEITYFLVILFSATREMLVTNQITGILMGVFALWYTQQLRFLSTKSAKNLAIVALAAIFLVDLKPHLFGMILLFSFIKNKNLKVIFTTVGAWAILHLFVDFTQQRILELDWLNILLDLQAQAKDGELPDAVSFWPLVSYLTSFDHLPTLVLMAPMLLGLIALTFYSTRCDFHDLLPWLFLLPASSIYFHYYDLVPALIFMVASQLKKSSDYFLFAIGFLVIPQEITNSRNFVFILAALISWKLLIDRSWSLRALSLSAFGLVVSYLCVRYFDGNPRLTQSWIVTESVIIAAIFMRQRQKVN
jgi:hypothetical protein